MARPKRKQSSRSSGPTVGKLPRRYTFMLNPFPEARLSSCPGCRKLTYPRKFPLFIHVDGWGPITQGKTCKYCSKCELIMCDQAELEAQLAYSFERLKPEVTATSTWWWVPSRRRPGKREWGSGRRSWTKRSSTWQTSKAIPTSYTTQGAGGGRARGRATWSRRRPIRHGGARDRAGLHSGRKGGPTARPAPPSLASIRTDKRRPAASA